MTIKIFAALMPGAVSFARGLDNSSTLPIKSVARETFPGIRCHPIPKVLDAHDVSTRPIDGTRSKRIQSLLCTYKSSESLTLINFCLFIQIIRCTRLQKVRVLIVNDDANQMHASKSHSLNTRRKLFPLILDLKT
jgi:hypothetical protein